MTTPISTLDRLTSAYQIARDALLAERNADGSWTGELSPSALSTATAVSALHLVAAEQAATSQPYAALIQHGLDWLVKHQNPDGGWGDTTRSLSNISTSMLVRAALHFTGAIHRETIHRLERYLDENCGRTPEERAEAIRARYGKDRTFAVPILTTCALAGFMPWREVTPLPFELACLPQAWFRFLRLPVVSYALPALIAIGQVIHHHRPSLNPLTWLTRHFAKSRSLRVLAAIQPSSGGFLEATPLTSFVTLSLAGIGQADHVVARKGVEFLANSVRPDGSWPIDSNLATWVTTLSLNALATAGELDRLDKKDHVRDWLLQQQFTQRHPYTGADPGGWGWTDLPGSVPDADDTPGALLALHHLFDGHPSAPVDDFIRNTIGPVSFTKMEEISKQLHYSNHATNPGFQLLRGIVWLLGLQNANGGWPTFCRGWGTLPFDRSGTDLTGHALRALSTWKKQLLASQVAHTVTTATNVKVFADGIRVVFPSRHEMDQVISKGLAYLTHTQRPDGSWLPLWFGNQHAPNDENPTYGTARVLAAYRDLDRMNSEPARKGVAWLLAAQNPDGGWGGAKDTPSSIEETALAVEVLLDAVPLESPAVNKGLAWLVDQVEAGGLKNPAPIGFYFAKLWYFEKLYPIIFSVAALGRARKLLEPP